MRGPSPSQVISLTRALCSLTRVRDLVLVVLMVGMSGLSVVSLCAQMGIVERLTGVPVPAGETSIGDALLWTLMGHPVYLSVTWLAPWVAVLVSALVDIRKAPSALCVLGESRMRCWGACCLAATGRALLLCFVLFASLAILMLLIGGRPSIEPSAIGGLSLGLVSEGSSSADVIALLLLMLLGAVACALLELVASLFVSPLLALLGSVALLVAAAYAPALPLPGSWLMASRVIAFAPTGSSLGRPWPMVGGFVLFAGISVACVCVGRRAFSRIDLGAREEGR